MTKPVISPQTREMLARIDAAIKERDTSRAAACRAAKLNPGYLRDVERRGTIPKYEHIKALAVVLDKSADYFWKGIEPDNVGDDMELERETISPPADLEPVRIPIVGIAYGSLIEATGLGDAPIGWVEAPPTLRRVPGAYAVYIDGESMIPAHNPGDLRFADPNRPIRPGDTVIIRSRNNTSEPIKLAIKRLILRDPQKVVVDQINPRHPAKIEIDRASIVSVDRVLTLNELFGV